MDNLPERQATFIDAVPQRPRRAVDFLFWAFGGCGLVLLTLLQWLWEPLTRHSGQVAYALFLLGIGCLVGIGFLRPLDRRLYAPGVVVLCCAVAILASGALRGDDPPATAFQNPGGTPSPTGSSPGSPGPSGSASSPSVTSPPAVPREVVPFDSSSYVARGAADSVSDGWIRGPVKIAGTDFDNGWTTEGNCSANQFADEGFHCYGDHREIHYNLSGDYELFEARIGLAETTPVTTPPYVWVVAVAKTNVVVACGSPTVGSPMDLRFDATSVIRVEVVVRPAWDGELIAVGNPRGSRNLPAPPAPRTAAKGCRALPR